MHLPYLFYRTQAFYMCIFCLLGLLFFEDVLSLSCLFLFVECKSTPFFIPANYLRKKDEIFFSHKKAGINYPGISPFQVLFSENQISTIICLNLSEIFKVSNNSYFKEFNPSSLLIGFKNLSTFF